MIPCASGGSVGLQLVSFHELLLEESVEPRLYVGCR